jgi:gamma-glutamylaminecyclotransferase
MKTITTEVNYIFVYGTLKKGFGNHPILQEIKAEFITEVETAERYPLVVNGLPYLLNMPGNGKRVKGELYNRTNPEHAMTRLDSLEGHPHFYRRQVIDVKDQAGNTVQAWAYFLYAPERVKRVLNEGQPWHSEYVDPKRELIKKLNRVRKPPAIKIHKNRWDNWNGYLGGCKVIEFGTDERAAKEWEIETREKQTNDKI